MLDKILEMHLILLAFTLTICYLALIRFKMHLKSNSSSTLGKRLKTNIALVIFTINKNIYIYIIALERIKLITMLNFPGQSYQKQRVMDPWKRELRNG